MKPTAASTLSVTPSKSPSKAPSNAPSVSSAQSSSPKSSGDTQRSLVLQYKLRRLNSTRVITEACEGLGQSLWTTTMEAAT